MRRRRMGRMGIAAAVAVAGSATLLSAGAQAGDDGQERAKETATLTMAADGKDLFFEGPGRVDAGAKLKIVNDTKPKVVGPHSFSLVKKADLPKNKQEGKDCENLEGICGKIAQAHEIDLETFEIGKPDVDVGKKGWDAIFGKEGDTWFTQEKGEKESRKVTAKAGTTLYYLCAVHPNMQGKLRVE